MSQTVVILESLNKVMTEMGQIASEVRELNTHYRARLQQAVEETKTQLEQRYKTQLERALEYNKEMTRQLVTEEIRSQFEAESRRLRENFQHQFEVAAANWQAERATLKAEISSSQKASLTVFTVIQDEIKKFESFIRESNSKLTSVETTVPQDAQKRNLPETMPGPSSTLPEGIASSRPLNDFSGGR
jgi:hypothetical protein